MLISYKWLREFTDTSLEPQEVRERLTMCGLAIDAVETHNDDSVLDVEVPSNRPDCLSHIGVAREVTVIERKPLRLPEAKSFKTEGRSANGKYDGRKRVTVSGPNIRRRNSATVPFKWAIVMPRSTHKPST